MNIDPTTETWEFLRWVFGDVIRPNGLWPSWMLEGLAVYFETKTNRLGRGRSPYWEGILRSQVAEGIFDSKRGVTMDRMNGEYPLFPSGEIPYLFGYHLWNKIGVDEQMGEYSIRSSRRFPYLVNSNLKNVTGKNWNQFWNEWSVESQEKYSSEIETLKAAGLSETEVISNSGFQALGGAISPDGRWIVYSETTLSKRNSLVAIDLKSGTKHHLVDKILGAQISFSKDSRFVLYSEMNQHDLVVQTSDLFAYDLQDHQYHQLTHKHRAKDPDLAPDQKKIAYLITRNSTHALVVSEFDANSMQTSNEKQVYLPAFGSILSGPRFTKDGTRIVFAEQTLGEGKSKIMEHDLATGMTTVLWDDGSMNRYSNFDFSGNLVFVSDKSGVEEVYKLSANGKEKTAVQLTRTVGGSWMPFFHPDGTLYVSALTGNGFEISKVKNQNIPQETGKKLVPRSPKPFDEALMPAKSVSENASIVAYSPWQSLLPRQWSPFYAFGTANDQILLGAELIGFDATGKHQYDLGTGYSFNLKTFDASIHYTNFSLGPLWTLAYSESSGSVSSVNYTRTKTFSTEFSLPLKYTFHSWTPYVAGFARDKIRKNIATGANTNLAVYEFTGGYIPGLSAGLVFQNLEYSRKGFMAEDGFLVRFAGESQFNSAEKRPIFKALLDAQTFLEIFDHSVLNPRIAYISSSHPADTLDSYTQLKGRSSIDSSDTGRGFTTASVRMRGYTDTFFITRSAAKASLDFEFPVAWLFSGGDTDPFFMNQITGAVFAENTFIPSRSKIHLSSIGAGLNLDTLIFFRVPMRLGIQGHSGLNKKYGGANEIFLSVTTGDLF